MPVLLHDQVSLSAVRILLILVYTSAPLCSIRGVRLFGTQLERLAHLSEAAPCVGITAGSSERREDAREDFALCKTHPACLKLLDREDMLVVEQTRCQPLP